MSYTPPVLAVIPYRILYLEGIQLSYIRVYTEIFHLWHANRQCFLGNPELAKRACVDERTVKNALKYFEEKGEIRRLQKGRSRYILPPVQAIETTPVDNSEEVSVKSVHVGKLVPPTGKVSSPQVGKLAPHKDKNINKEINKSSCPSDFQKPKAPLADVTKQSTSYDEQRMNQSAPISGLLANWLKDHPEMRKHIHDPTQLPADTSVQPQIPQRTHSGVQGAQYVAAG